MSATVLQLKYPIKPGQMANEALVHLDGPNGGGFQWVATPNCMLLEKYAAPYAYPQPMSRKQLSASEMRKYTRPAQKTEKVAPALVEVRKQEVSDPKEAKRKREMSERAASPPPRARLRRDVKGPVLMASGALYDDDTDDEEVIIRGDNENEQVEPRRKRFKHPDNFEIISKIVARRKNKLRGPLNREGVVEYLVEWSGYPDDAKLSWESRTALMKDVPAVVLEFDVRYPGRPAEVSIPVDKAVLADAYEKSDVQPNRNKVVGKRRKLAPGESPPPIPSYVESPLLDLSFSGMVLHLRPTGWNLFSSPEDAQRDAQIRKERYKSEYPKFADCLFPPTIGDLADRERAKARERETLENHKSGGRKKLYRWPRILGGVLLRDTAHPTSTMCIQRAPASWESYFLSMGLSCDNWERQYVPHMPTAPESVHESVGEANDQLLFNLRRTYAWQMGKGRTESLSAPVEISEVEDNLEAPNGILLETNGDVAMRENGVINDKDSGPSRPLVFTKVNPNFSKALAKSKRAGDKGQKYYDPIWCCWRERTTRGSKD
eukprot:Plantae.Rhodophyta-Hildenbrandia_rubra.ctg9955.p1 GENE.Plantae.Rhodophyta-Hildenbrandia_rubra.ctg9955~~Plantae.Rhodophyta-Hildenbrandia_rubra.ctg9955.p1  ORF type:complete len:547 (-),score=97.54 Plantae.Rhodophyta-Hildenbrandia_rubra.ctg9955:1772-3412(-)